MSETALPSKKRKRTGSEREKKKQAYLEAQKNPQPVESVKIDDEVDGVTAAQPETSKEFKKPSVTVEKEDVNVDGLIGRIPQALKTLHPAFKHAKTFEIRRLVKKIKQLRTKDGSKEEIGDLEAQLALLSHIHLDPIIASHLQLKLSKHHRFKHISLPPSIISAISSHTTSKDTKEAETSSSVELRRKVENRLYSAKPVAPVVISTISWLLGEEVAKLGKPMPSQAKSIGNGTPIKQAKTAVKVEEREATRAAKVVKSEPSVGEKRLQADDENESDVDEEDLAADAAGWESGSVDDTFPGGGLVIGSDSEPESDSDDDENEAEEEDIKSLKPSKSAKLSSQPSTKPTKPTKETKTSKKISGKEDFSSSLFLPSLSTGFTRGDDGDSDPDFDDDFDDSGVIGKKGGGVERKNRRGQRARQAIWEKKYGKNAKHVVKAKQSEAEEARIKAEKARNKFSAPRDSGWGAKAASTVGRPAPTPTTNPASIPITTASTGAGTAGGAPGDKALHPSWEAAKQRKKQADIIASAPQAKKIVFD